MLEKSAEKYKESIKDGDSELWAEKTKRQETEAKLSEAQVDIQRLKFALHNSEQEIVRLQNTVDNLAKFHPGTVKRLQDIPIDQRFPVRS